MPHLICYDISKNSLRTKLGKRIIRAGLDRINKSVYLGTITDSSLTTLEKEVATLLTTTGEPQDSLIVIPITTQHVQQLRVYGKNELDKDELTGDKTTLII